MYEYNQALKEVEKYLIPSIGFSNQDSPKEDSKIIIRQNNTIAIVNPDFRKTKKSRK